MNSREVIRAIEKAGWDHVATKGEHWQFKHQTRRPIKMGTRDSAPSKTRSAYWHATQPRETVRGQAEVTRMAAYIALLRKDPGSDYGVDFPDFPGCVTAGRTLEEARMMAAEALALHVQGMAEDHEPLPKPSVLDVIMADPDSQDMVAFLVEVPNRPAKAVRINVMLPSDLLEAIDRQTANRSRFLADAARAKLGRVR